ncbi:hypothetical protein Ciccas_003705 [Cichlidogyrus casuarinus]|uniref:PH domain-containing protein n=1 Tax=Cichlidogyrus casuarinus TaxID=1844966 RepID=A0ABD2QDM9_9PLAT
MSKLKTMFSSTLPKQISKDRPLSAIFPSYETASIHSRFSSFSSVAVGLEDLNIWDDFGLSCIASYPLHKSSLVCLNDKENVSLPSTRSTMGRDSLNSLVNYDAPTTPEILEDPRRCCKLFMFSCGKQKLVLFFDYAFDASDWSTAISSAIEDAKRTRKTLQRSSSSESELSIVNVAETSLTSNFSSFFINLSHKPKPRLSLEADQSVTLVETRSERPEKISSNNSNCVLS